MTEATSGSATTSDTDKLGWARTLLIIAAGIEFLGSLAAVPMLFLDLPEMPGPPLTGTLITIRLLLQPVLALAALVFVLQYRVTYAIYALAALILVMWASLLPTIAEHGLDLSGFAGIHAIYEVVVLPLIAGAAAALAVGRKKLATMLVTLPTMLDLVSVIAFAISAAMFAD